MGTTQRGSTAWMRHQIVQDKIWRIIDARDQVLGRVAVQISKILQGKHKAMYFRNMDCGDPVIVINARHFALTGRKRFNKVYPHYTGYPGGRKEVPIRRVMEKRPDDVIRRAVKGMLPSNRLRKIWLSNLRIYQDDQHDHHAQKPVPVPPVTAGRRLGTGGPPTVEELDHWWVENLIHVPDHILEEVVAEVREEMQSTSNHSYKKAGLAELLELSPENEPTTAEREAHVAYLSAAEKSLNESPVIVPSSLL